MTSEERQMIEELAARLRNSPPPQVDRDADELIRHLIGNRPDALYVLTQTVLVQEMALNQAKAQLDELSRRQPQASFLGTPPQPASPSGGYRGSGYQTGNTPPPLPPQYEAPQYPLPQYPPQYYAPPQSRFSSFLHNAAQTAAGVVAGEVAFSALSSLFGHRDGGYYGGGGGFLSGAPPMSPVSETIVNNYYEDDRGSSSAGGDSFASDDSGDSPDDDSSYDDSSDSDSI